MGSKPIWLLVNARSGSNSERALAQLHDCLDGNGFAIDREIVFPDEDLPTPGDLDAAGIDTLAIFTGDGSLNAAIANLSGLGGAVLVRPGGTMNLLSNRLHGTETTVDEIVARVGRGAARALRPSMIRCEAGKALAGLLVGPGTSWAPVREAMRDFDIAGVAQGTNEALAETTGGSNVRLVEPETGHPDGYPLLELTPSHRGIQVDGFRSDGAGELLQQSWALLRRRFREGPHERLGLLDRMLVENCEGQPLRILVDGEPATLGSRAEFEVAPCEVDLLATDHGY